MELFLATDPFAAIGGLHPADRPVVIMQLSGFHPRIDFFQNNRGDRADLEFQRRIDIAPLQL